MEERQNVDVLFLGTVSHETPTQGQASEKSNYQDEISFMDPVQVELLRIPNGGKELYGKLTSQTQKQPIKSLEIYYRNVDKKMARYSLLFCSTSELLVSSSTGTDILVTLKETIYTDMLVIRGNFTSITFCIYGKVIQNKDEIQKKCPFFMNNVEVSLKEEQIAVKINRNIFEESRKVAKAIQDQYCDLENEPHKNSQVYSSQQVYSNDKSAYELEISNITKLAEQLLTFEDLSHLDQRIIVDIRNKLQSIKSFLQKLFKTAKIGLYHPSPYRVSQIPEAIPVSIVKIAVKMLPQSLSDQHRALDVLKLILQLGPHAQFFVKLGGVQALISLFLQFFSSNLVILSSLKSLIIQVFIALSFWEPAATKMVAVLPNKNQPNSPSKSKSDESDDEPEEGKIKDQRVSLDKSRSKSKSKSKSRSRSRDKKKKRSQVSESKESDNGRKKHKKQKKSKSSKSKGRSRDQSRGKDKKKDKTKSNDSDKNKMKDEKAKKQQQQPEKQVDMNSEIKSCNSFYQVLFKVVQYEKNYKIQYLLRILIQQITQTLTKSKQLSFEIATYTPLIRDLKYMFNQGGQIINSKVLKLFSSFQPFLNQEQSKGVQNCFICESEKLKNPLANGISPKVFKLIDSALMVLQSKGQDQISLSYDEEFITLISSLIQRNKNGLTIGLSNFIDAIKIQTLLGLKKQEAVVAIICEYIHQVLLQENGINLILYMDQIHNSMIKIISWLRQDKTFSLEIKRKVQYLVNSVMIVNNFSGTEGNFKNLYDYFTKLIGHQHLQINKIVEYSRREYNKTTFPLSFANLSQNFSLGNFHEVMPAQPLLEVDICLKVFLTILKINKNVWTVLYQFKFLPAFSTLFLKVHSLLKFFLTPSLERLNSIIDIKMYERLINNYLQVAKHIVSIFVCKVAYETAFNELIQQEQIFDVIQIIEKSVQMYLFLFSVFYSQNSLISQKKTFSRIREILQKIAQLLDTFLKGFQIAKNNDRQRAYRALLKNIYRQHYQTIEYRSGVLNLFSILAISGGISCTEVMKTFFDNRSIKDEKNFADLLIPNNSKSIIQNIIRKNIYRSDPQIIQNLSGLISQLIKKNIQKEQIFQILQNIGEQLKQQLEELNESVFAIQKNIQYAVVLSRINVPLNPKVQLQMIRLLKYSLGLKNLAEESNDLFTERQLRLRNKCIEFFRMSLKNNSQFSQNLFQQYLKAISGVLQMGVSAQNHSVRILQLKGTFSALQSLIQSSSYLPMQSILLFGQFSQNPQKPACELSLQKIVSFFQQGNHKQIIDEEQLLLVKQIAVSAIYLLCKLTTIDKKQFYSTKSRKNAISYLLSPQKLFTLSDIAAIFQDLVPKSLLTTLKNYSDFPIVQKSQIEPEVQTKQFVKSQAFIYSRAVFSLISQNEPVGKTRYQLIQQKWRGGDTVSELYRINLPRDYKQILKLKIKDREQIQTQIGYFQSYNGIHTPKQVNNLFNFKIRKIFTTQAKKNAVSANSTTSMRIIPIQVKKPQIISKQAYQSKLNTSPALNRIPSATNPNNNNNHIPQMKPSYPIVSNTNSRPNSNPRDSSPYKNQIPQPPMPKTLPTYTPPANTNYYYNNNKNNPNMYVPPATNKMYPVYDQMQHQPPIHGYDARSVGGYYNPNYAPRGMPTYPAPGGYMQPPHMMPQHGMPINPVGIQPMYRPIIQSQPPVRQIEEEKANEAIQILLYLQQNQNAIDKEQRKNQVNQLLKIPLVHERVTKYFDELKRG